MFTLVGITANDHPKEVYELLWEIIYKFDELYRTLLILSSARS